MAEPIKSKISYNGSYVSFDNDVDYQAKINEAVAKGDYQAASGYEAARNAKIEYMNSLGMNSSSYTPTTNYITSNAKNTNNAPSYVSAHGSLGDLPDGWTTANVKGYNYTNSDGVIKQGGYAIGNKINPLTGEAQFNNVNDARKYAATQALISGGVGEKTASVRKAGLGGDELLDYIIKAGLIDEGYVNALLAGNVSGWTKNKRDEAKELEKAKAVTSFSNKNKNLPYPEVEYVNDNAFEKTQSSSRRDEFINSLLYPNYHVK